MSSTTNTAINSRSMNGVITISDGQATLENGDLNCDDIISSSLNTSNINTSLLTCSGKFECNLNGPYTVPVSISNLTGLLISYGNVTNSGATDFTNFQSNYTSTQGGFRFFNKSATQTLTNLAIIDNSQTYFSSKLTNCTAESPLNANSIANKTYIDSNFVDRTNNLTQNINGLKTFTNDTNFTGSLLAKTNLKMNSVGFKTGNAITLTFPLEELTILAPSSGTATTLQLPPITLNEVGMVFTFFKRGSTAFNTTINATNNIFLSNATSGVLTNTTLLDTTKYLCKLLVSGTSSAIWIEVTDYSIFDREQNNLLYARLASPNAFTNTNTFNSFLPTSTITASLANELVNFTCLNAQSFVKPSFNNVWTGTNTFNSFLPTSTITASSNNELVNFTTLNGQSFVKPSFNNVWTGTNSFNSFLPTSTLTPSSGTQIITKTYVDDNFLDRTNNLTQNINGLKTFTDDLTAPNIYCNTALYFRDINLGLNKALIFHQADIVYFDTLTVFDNYWKFKCFNIEQVVISQVSSTFNNKLISLAQARFDNFTPSCTVSTPTQINHLTRKDYIDNNFLDRTNNLTQNINGLKTFTNTTTFTSGLKTDSILVNNNNINFGICSANTNTSIRVGNASNSLTIETPRITLKPSSNTYSSDIEQSGINFFIKNNNLNGTLDFRVSTNAVVLLLDVINTTISNNLISNSQATFNNFTPICSVASPTANNHLTRKDYIDNNFMNLTTGQTIVGNKIFNGNTSYNGTALYCNCAGEFGNLVHLRNFTRVYDIISPFTGYTQLYTSGNNFFIYPVIVNSGIHFYCRNSANLEVQTFISSATANTSLVPFVASSTATFNSSLISNNLTAPTSTSVNNIYRTLVSGGEINFGSQLSANYIFGQTTFNSASIFNLGCSFLGSLTFNNGGTFSEIEQTSGSNLVIKNTTNSRDIILSTTSASTGQVDSLTINTTSCDILSPTLNLTSSSTINILTPNNLTGVINFLSTLTTATVNFCSTAYTSIFNLNARLAHKGVQYMNEVKIISGTSLTLAFPLEQRWQFTSTGATQIVIDLPQLTATSQTGFYFSFYKTASNTNSVKFNRQGTNVIRPLNSITDLTTITVISGTSVTGGFLTAELSSGNFAWIYINA